MNTWLPHTRLQGSHKFWVVLPLIILPFLTLLFWLLGGGQNKTTSKGSGKGLNLQLPSPDLSEKPSLEGLTKLRLYALAAQDSVHRRKMRRKDSYAISDYIETAFPGLAADRANTGMPSGAMPVEGPPETQTALRDLQVQLQALHQTIGQQAAIPTTTSENSLREPSAPSLLMVPPQTGPVQPADALGDTADAELRQLNGMLDKILDIQHRENPYAPASEQNDLPHASYLVSGDAPPVSLLKTPLSGGSLQAEGRENGFYTLGLTEKASTAIEATVYGTQTLVSGTTVRLRLLQDIRVQGNLIGKNHLLFGIATLRGDRLQIRIDRVVAGNQLIPLQLIAYDLDGIPGLHIPGTLTAKSARDLATNGASSLGGLAFNPSVGSRIAQAGIHAAQGWIRRKARRVTITLRDGYRMLLSPANPH
jgi:conjugative transposon TraM protein